jgi:hypothetical protein
LFNFTAKENLKSDRYFNQNQCSIFNFFAKRRLLKDIKNKINSGDWLILNEKDFSPMMSIVKKSVFEAKFYTGTVYLSDFKFSFASYMTE